MQKERRYYRRYAYSLAVSECIELPIGTYPQCWYLNADALESVLKQRLANGQIDEFEMTPDSPWVPIPNLRWFCGGWNHTQRGNRSPQ